jgi:hypothetical protein
MDINIATDYTKKPGGRYVVEGPYSGEEFRELVLKPAFIKALANGENLKVILDGGYGYGTSFLEEAFGGLVRDVKDPEIKNIEIVSEEEPEKKQRIQEYIQDAFKALGR